MVVLVPMVFLERPDLRVMLVLLEHQEILD